MAITSSKPYDWLKVIQPELVKLQDLSTTGGPDVFSWEQLTAILAQRFELTDLLITLESAKWLSDRELSAAASKQTSVLNYAMAGLPGKVAWAMSDKDVAILMSALLTKNPQALDYSDRDFQAGFYRFLGIAITNALTNLGFQGDYALTPLDDDHLPKGPAVSMEVAISLLGTTVKGRVIANEEFIKVWKERFGSKTAIYTDSAQARDIDILIHFEAGKVTLPRSQLKTVHTGDFIILDSCTLIPGEDKGRVMLTIRGVPIFRGMLKENKIKVLEYPLYHKVDTPMNDDDDINFDKIPGLEEEAGLEEDEAAGGMGEAPSLAERAKDIPVTITVEVGRLNMKLDKLMQLQAGQLLELEVNPEEGVNLCVNGQCIGRGELLRLGEVLGVRVLELG